MIVDQLGDVIGQVALKDSKFNRGGELTGLHSARRLARQLFSTLSDVHPARNHLVVEGMALRTMSPHTPKPVFYRFLSLLPIHC